MQTDMIQNSKGEYVAAGTLLNSREKYVANVLQKKFDDELKNALGFEVNITTLTAISKRVVSQKFFEIAPADYMPVRVGENAWSTEILTYRAFDVAGDFETGLINTGGNNSRLAEDDAALDSVSIPTINWAKQISWALPDLKFAAKSGNWDVVTAKEKARKKDWDLGIQKVAFLGLKANASVRGLLTQSDVAVNTTLITKYISTMTTAEFNTFVAGIVGAYRLNSNFTSMPTHFVIPELDYNGLAAPSSADFPIRSRLDLLLETFRTITRNPNFQILPCAYCDKINNATVAGLNKNRYALYNFDEDSARMDIPVDYTNTLQNTINGFQFQNVAYGQFTGFKAYRPREMLYLDWT